MSDYSPGFEPLEQFKRDAKRGAPAPVDFSERIMQRIELDSAGSSNYTAHKPKRMAIGIAIIALTVTLLCGFTYAITAGVLTIKDDAGREIMQVQSPDPIPAEQAELQERIEKVVEDQLQQGEAAQIVIGQEDIDAVKRYEEPKDYYPLFRGFSYSSTQDIPRLVGHLNELKKLGDQVMNAKLTKAELFPYLGHPNAVQSDKWVDATDAASGTPYAYYKLKPDEQAYMEDAVLSLTYQEGDLTFKLIGNYGEFTSVTIFDNNPSAKRMHEVEGISVYHSEGQETPYLTWLEPVGDGELMYWLNSNAEIKQQLKFAEAVIKATKRKV
ncbi:hypothetical protein [Paenibacillus sp. JDR-2]|uniref:hypothetical protein n=1 Tax=Paenibacillus sp. (strain JDR-2) TaxID=324057 RepID=UPI000166B208|nr:hypothetical protein [Paenibacillus sp. JDR-2]ACS99211.1 hypothetical protein Pjdr2_0532 [Paenibacillus sp. JDR-2]